MKKKKKVKMISKFFVEDKIQKMEKNLIIVVNSQKLVHVYAGPTNNAERNDIKSNITR